MTQRNIENYYPSQDSLLYALGKSAIPNKDVPVGAFLQYGKVIIGKGSNTVRSKGNAGGHAEINAISDAIQRMGLDRFKALNRDSLFLYTSYEPCPMCRGAIIEYQIRQLVFVESKSMHYRWTQEILPTWNYFFIRRKAESEVQKRLFQEFIETHAPAPPSPLSLPPSNRPSHRP